MRAPLVLLLALAGSAPALAQGAAGDLAPLLAGFERCNANGALKALEKSLVARYSNDADAKVARNDTKVAIKVPASVQAALGPVTSTLKDGYTEVRVPLSGAYKGFEVRGLTFAFGNENGIGSRALVLAGPAEPVKAAFGPSLAAAQKAQAKGGAEVSFSVLASPATTILCDFSN